MHMTGTRVAWHAHDIARNRQKKQSEEFLHGIWKHQWAMQSVLLVYQV